MTTEYNGWTNYATWRVNLEMFDGQNYADENYLDAIELSHELRDIAEAIICDNAPEGFARDYALAFLSDVNWHEIATHMIEDYRATDDDEDLEKLGPGYAYRDYAGQGEA